MATADSDRIAQCSFGWFAELVRVLFPQRLLACIALLAMILAVCCPSHAASQPQKKTGTEKSQRALVFELLDKSKDKKLDGDEFLGGAVGKAAEAKREEFDAWDLNHDKGIDFDEFKKRGNKPPDQDQLRKEFANRDKDKSGFLTYEEFIGNRKGEEQIAARDGFYRFDANQNGQVSIEEFLDRHTNRPVSVHNEFRRRDLDSNGKLTEDEYVRPQVGGKWEQGSRRNFKRFDLDRDQHLNEREFALTPAQKPDERATFYGLDVDQNGELTPDEATRFMPSEEARRVRQTCLEFDDDRSGGWNLDEYLARASAMSWAKTKRSIMAWLETLGLAVIIVADICLLSWSAYVVHRWWRRKKGHVSPNTEATARTAGR